jgi:hypothetical protein
MCLLSNIRDKLSGIGMGLSSPSSDDDDDSASSSSSEFDPDSP